MNCFGVVAIDCFIQNALLVNGVIFPHVMTVNFHMYVIAFTCLFTQLLHKYFRTPAVQFSRSVMSDSLWPHGLQHARLPCPSPTPRAYSHSGALSQWCHPTISSSVIPFSSQLQSFPASGCFQMSQFFASRGQNIGFNFSISPSNEHSELTSFRMDWLDLCCYPRDSQESSPAP